MRVIAGTARSLPLRTPPGVQTRPTTDRIKETLFNIRQPYLPGCRFLDLFSGSGAIGIEALSRGAGSAVFVENNRAACSCIRSNLSFTKLSENGRLLNMDVLQAISRLEGEPPFDLIFMDPPYGKGWEQKVLSLLRESTLVSEKTLIVMEESLEEDFSWVHKAGFLILREKNYKTNKHIFVQKE